jgi:hypothetical protein
VRALAILVLAACSSASAPATSTSAGTSQAPATNADAGACDMRASGVSYASPACDACMQRSCCAETVACFARAAEDCRALDTCLSPCPHDATIFVDQDDGGSSVDDSSCRSACEAAHPSSIGARRRYHACVLDHCLTECTP